MSFLRTLHARMASTGNHRDLRPADGPVYRDDTVAKGTGEDDPVVVSGDSGDSHGHRRPTSHHRTDLSLPTAEGFRNWCFHHSSATASKSDASYEEGYSRALWVAVDFLLHHGLVRPVGLDQPPLGYDSMDSFVVSDDPDDVIFITPEPKETIVLDPPPAPRKRQTSPVKKRRRPGLNILAGHASAVKIDWIDTPPACLTHGAFHAHARPRGACPMCDRMWVTFDKEKA